MTACRGHERRDLAKCVMIVRKKLSTGGYCALVAVASDGEVRGLAVLKGVGHHAEIKSCTHVEHQHLRPT